MCGGVWPVMVMCVLRGVACDGDVCVGGVACDGDVFVLRGVWPVMVMCVC